MTDQKYCRNCGAPNLPEAKFCANCSKAFVSGDAAAPLAAASAASTPWEQQPQYSPSPEPKIFGLSRKMVVIGILALVVVLTLGCIVMASQSPSSSTPTPTAKATVAATATAKATATPTPKPTATPAPTPSGQGTASNSHYSFTARSQGVYTESNQFMQPDPGNKYVQVYVEVTNKDVKNALIGNMFQYKLFDNQNIGHSAATVSADQIESLQNSNPGDKVAGIVVFEIAAGNTPTKIVFEPGIFQDSLTVNF
jgi:septal ring-binding cell division protein DamX